jgi:hypothetical protein
MKECARISIPSTYTAAGYERVACPDWACLTRSNRICLTFVNSRCKSQQVNQWRIQEQIRGTRILTLLDNTPRDLKISANTERKINKTYREHQDGREMIGILIPTTSRRYKQNRWDTWVTDHRQTQSTKNLSAFQATEHQTGFFVTSMRERNN